MRKLNFNELHGLSSERRIQNSLHKRPIAVILDDIRSLHNVGAIFRTADGAGLEHLYLCGITGTPPRNEIRKTSLGAEESVPWTYHKDALEPLQSLCATGYQIIVLEQTNESVDYRLALYRFPVCLIIGHEFHGVRDQLVAAADLAIDIPMYGVKQSLNVSVAFGIAVYEIGVKYEEIAVP